MRPQARIGKRKTGSKKTIVQRISLKGTIWQKELLLKGRSRPGTNAVFRMIFFFMMVSEYFLPIDLTPML